MDRIRCAYHVISKDPASLDGFTTDFNSVDYVMFKGTGMITYDSVEIRDYQEKNKMKIY